MRLILFFLLLSNLNLPAQQKNCLPTAEITIFPTEIVLASNKYQIKKDKDFNYVLFYPEGEKHSFWYKLSIDSDCRFSFKITSADSANTSSYFLYKNPDIGNFCDDINNKKIIPARSGKFFNEDKNPKVTILSQRKKEEINFVQPVTASKGEIYFLNIQHQLESDCGHFLNLIVSSEIVSFRATYKTCFEEEKKVNPPLTKIESITEIKIEEKRTPAEVKPSSIKQQDPDALTKTDSKNKQEISSAPEKDIPQSQKITEIAIATEKSPLKRNITHVTVSGIVTDSLSKKPIQAELKWTDEITGKEIIAHTNPNGEYAILLDEKVIYKLTCSVVGYREKTTKFIRQNLNSESLRQDFEMTDLKPGENFTLRHIYFYAGNYAMKPESNSELEKLYNYLVSHEKVRIEIQGHTNGEGKIKKQKSSKKKKEEGWDFHGNEKKLSKYRAEAIKTYLLRKGIAPERVSAEGMGATKMIYPEPKNQKEREANRRVEVYIYSTGADLASVLNAISE